MMSNLIKKVGGGLALAMYSMLAQAEYALNLPQPATEIARQIFDLHTITMWIIVGIAVVVYGAMFWSILKHRKSVGHKAANFHHNTMVEIVWTTIPLLILIVMAYPATKSVLAMRDTSNPDMTVKITGYQWKWEYDYQQDGFKFMSVLSTPREQLENYNGKSDKGENYLLEVDNPMVVPVGKKVRVLLTASDVIHAWWVPEFGIKQDAIPGFIKDSWFKADKAGIYRGQCAELCGKDHGYMPIVVEVKEQADYDKWLAEQKTKAAAASKDAGKVYELAELKSMGEKVYAANCAGCHQAKGEGMPPVFPALDGSKMVNGPKQAQIDIVMNGKAGTAMPAFGNQMSDTDIAAVITYTRNAWSNKAGDVTQSSEIKALRK
ncbi:MAG: cytochrome c oxidase subunit II [Gallionellales bacterium 35-53-114]|jgi:cytochrome c oxidase subunit 2|nr:MAG: cytochrome c oxidase subunit II [Gallionellales bacterium 35-53-114]OYZ62480.1 MAG: cytochrome c oxidase subunit II [Gallionellales bacterium 24-53-125]OZB08540.1 MAG: cytochrome c oxidase subunit II [Gallionellales bacterium 39-52-133]